MTASFAISVRQFALLLGTNRLPIDGFLLIFVFGYFSKSVEKIQVPLKSDKNIGTLREDLHTFMVIQGD